MCVVLETHTTESTEKKQTNDKCYKIANAFDYFILFLLGHTSK